MSTDQSRRTFVGTGVVAAAVTAAALSRSASAQTATGVPKVEYAIKKLPFDPAKIKGISEKLLVSHYENNYSGAVKRLNAITAQLAGLDVAAAPVFVINGLKREELIATNSMIIHELYFDGLGGMALVAAWWGIWDIVTGLLLATWWARRGFAAGGGDMTGAVAT